jgi:hypothetical protein
MILVLYLSHNSTAIFHVSQLVRLFIFTLKTHNNDAYLTNDPVILLGVYNRYAPVPVYWVPVVLGAR